MGFRSGAYAKVWEVIPMTDSSTKLRMSISRKNRQSGEYEQDFSGFVLCIGTVAASNALKLKEGSRIKLGDCDVTTKYDAQKRVTYTNYKIFSFETIGNNEKDTFSENVEPEVDSGDVDDERLPF